MQHVVRCEVVPDAATKSLTICLVVIYERVGKTFPHFQMISYQTPRRHIPRTYPSDIIFSQKPVKMHPSPAPRVSYATVNKLNYCGTNSESRLYRAFNT
jgi:hypothetical protein